MPSTRSARYSLEIGLIFSSVCYANKEKMMTHNLIGTGNKVKLSIFHCTDFLKGLSALITDTVLARI